MKLLQSIAFGILALTISGCAVKPTRVSIMNVSREKVAEALWQKGGKRWDKLCSGTVTAPRAVLDRPPQGKWATLFSSKVKEVWPKPEQLIKANQDKVVAKYSLDHAWTIAGWFLDAKDTIGLRTEYPNQVVLSLECKEKKETWCPLPLLCTLEDLLSFYQRNIDRERDVVLETVWTLKSNDKVGAYWPGKGTITNRPKSFLQGHTTWIAYKGGTAAPVINYLNKHDYEKSVKTSPHQIIFKKAIVHHPKFLEGLLFPVPPEQESLEEIHIKVIDPKNYPDCNEPTVAIGIATSGFMLKPSSPDGIDISNELRDNIIFVVWREVNLNRKPRKQPVFVDPYRWVEDIELRETRFIKKGKEQLRQEKLPTLRQVMEGVFKKEASNGQ